MLSLIVAVSITSGLTDYPGFRQSGAVVEAQIDRGPIVELVINCRHGRSAIISYSKVDRRYCTPRFECGGSLKHAVAETCSGRRDGPIRE